MTHYDSYYSGVKVVIGEIDEIPVLFKSMIPSDENMKVDFDDDSVLSKIANSMCSINECDYDNGGCSHECRANKYHRAGSSSY